ncbi:T9SS type A sorting domain-containing protein [bacterium]|nr:T9SS type A sorting domain-containing protein [bacterium]
MTKIPRTAVLFALLLLAAPALAQQWHWFGPYNFHEASTNLSMNYGSPSPAARFTTSAAGDLQWAYMGLDLPAGAMIDSVTLCYELSTTSTFISTLRFSDMDAPDVAMVMLDLPSDLHSPTPVCVTQPVGLTTPQRGLLNLGLRLNFASTAHYVEIGAVGVLVSNDAASSTGERIAPTQPRLLGRNAPNPFNPGTRIEFELPAAADIALEIYNVKGERVATLLDGVTPAGRHHVAWNGRDDAGQEQASGVYLTRLTVGDRVETRRMSLVR